MTELFSDLDTQIPQVLAENVAPGAAVAAYDHQGELFCKGYGWRDAANTLPVNGDTRFAIASISKTMTALVAGTLAHFWSLYPIESIPFTYPGSSLTLGNHRDKSTPLVYHTRSSRATSYRNTEYWTSDVKE